MTLSEQAANVEEPRVWRGVDVLDKEVGAPFGSGQDAGVGVFHAHFVEGLLLDPIVVEGAGEYVVKDVAAERLAVVVEIGGLPNERARCVVLHQEDRNEEDGYEHEKDNATAFHSSSSFQYLLL